jgi:hypothetical protein
MKKNIDSLVLLFVGLLLRIYHISQVDLISAKSIASGHFIDQRSKETIEKETMILI